jgi:predicted nuclease of predicted toxin-antitoxin system
VIFWLDAQLPPGMAPWLSSEFGIAAISIRDVGLRNATDHEIFAAAGQANATLVSKDADFVELVQRLGAPPQLLWVTCGNASKSRMREVFKVALPAALVLLSAGESIIEIGDKA